MKKTVKSLIIAASVAAIAGIGAVSFAAWNGNTQTNNVTGAATGHVDTTGFGDGTTTSLSLQLMPQDQQNIDTTSETTMYDIKLVVVGNDVSGYKIQGKYTAEKDGSAYTWTTATTGDDAKAAGKLEYKIDQSATATYAAGWTTWTPNESNVADLVGGGTLTEGDWYVHVALTSEQAADMDVDLSFSFKLVEKGE
ncbi:MAG: hypothetical protein K2J01_04685 [Clostridiales bacterium]|nr:hypothetical protein [Clostridiales bacterium]